MSLGRRPPGIQNKAVFAGEECGGLCIVTLLVIYPESVIYRGPVVHLIHQRDTKQRKAVHTKIKNLFVALGMLSFLVQLSLLCLTLTGMFWAPQKKDKPALLISYRNCLPGSLQVSLVILSLLMILKSRIFVGWKRTILPPYFLFCMYF